MPSDNALVDCATSLDECPSDFMTLGKRCIVSKRSIALSSDAVIKSRPALTALNAIAPAEKFLMLSFSLSNLLALCCAWSALLFTMSLNLTIPPPLCDATSPACLIKSALTLKPLPLVLVIALASLTFSAASLKASPLPLVSMPASLTLKLAVLKSSLLLLALVPAVFTFSLALLKPSALFLALLPASFNELLAFLKPLEERVASDSSFFKSLARADSLLPLTCTSMTIFPSAIYSSSLSNLYLFCNLRIFALYSAGS